jgi:hypothetical protein
MFSGLRFLSLFIANFVLIINDMGPLDGWEWYAISGGFLLAVIFDDMDERWK